MSARPAPAIEPSKAARGTPARPPGRDEPPPQPPHGGARPHPIQHDVFGEMKSADEQARQYDRVGHVDEHQVEKSGQVTGAEPAVAAHRVASQVGLCAEPYHENCGNKGKASGGGGLPARRSRRGGPSPGRAGPEGDWGRGRARPGRRGWLLRSGRRPWPACPPASGGGRPPRQSSGPRAGRARAGAAPAAVPRGPGGSRDQGSTPPGKTRPPPPGRRAAGRPGRIRAAGAPLRFPPRAERPGWVGRPAGGGAAGGGLAGEVSTAGAGVSVGGGASFELRSHKNPPTAPASASTPIATYIHGERDSSAAGAKTGRAGRAAGAASAACLAPGGLNRPSGGGAGGTRGGARGVGTPRTAEGAGAGVSRTVRSCSRASRASRMASAEAKRRSGSFSSTRSTRSASAAGRSARSVRGSSGAVCTCAISIITGVSAVKGRRPVSIS